MLNIRGDDWTDVVPVAGGFEPTMGVFAALAVVVDASEGRFDNLGVVAYTIEDGILHAVASPALPESFTTRLGGAPVMLLDQLAPDLAAAARAGRPVLNSEVAVTRDWNETDVGDVDIWPSVATAAAVDGHGTIVGYIEVARRSGDRPTDEEFAFLERLAACVAEVIVNTDT